MLTVFAVPKPFKGHIATIQRNAITSWTLLRPQPEIYLFGDEEGTEQICQEMKLHYVPKISRNEFGTPLLNDVFDKAKQLATFNLLCFVNADIILMSDFMRAIEQLKTLKRTFVLAGAKRNIDITKIWDFNQMDWEGRLIALVKQNCLKSKVDYKLGADYFVFPRGFFMDMPALTPRWAWDGWLLWKAGAKADFLIDATPTVFAVHQNHDYSLIHTNGKPPWLAEEARHNLQLADISRYWFLYEATHSLTPVGLKRLWFQKEILGLKNLLIYRLGKLRHMLGLRRLTLCKINNIVTSVITQKHK